MVSESTQWNIARHFLIAREKTHNGNLPANARGLESTDDDVDTSMKLRKASVVGENSNMNPRCITTPNLAKLNVHYVIAWLTL